MVTITIQRDIFHHLLFPAISKVDNRNPQKDIHCSVTL